MFLLLSPLTWLLVTLIVTIFAWRFVARTGRGLLTVAIMTCLFFCSPAGANWLVSITESRIPKANRCKVNQTAPIVVLAGGWSRQPAYINDYSALGHESWRRLTAAVALYQAGGFDRLWIVGGGEYAIKESRVMRALAIDLGVSEAMISIEDESTNTHDSAQAMRGRLPNRFTLVSSALHLPRAVQVFSLAGYMPCAAPSSSDYLGPGGWSLTYYLPQSTAVLKTQRAMHELIGTIAYVWRGSNN